MKQLFAPIIESIDKATGEYLNDNKALKAPVQIEDKINSVLGLFMHPITRLYYKHTAITGERLDPTELYAATHRHNDTIERMQDVLEYMNVIDHQGKYLAFMDDMYATLQRDIMPKFTDTLYVSEMFVYTQTSLNVYASTICVMAVIDIMHYTTNVKGMIDTITSEQLSVR